MIFFIIEVYIIIFIINFSCFFKSIIWKRFTSAPSFAERKQWIFSKNSRMCIFSLFLFRVVLQVHICWTHVRVYLNRHSDLTSLQIYNHKTPVALCVYLMFRIRQLLLNKIFNCLDIFLSWREKTPFSIWKHKFRCCANL